jgi:hypothetical protein
LDINVGGDGDVLAGMIEDPEGAAADIAGVWKAIATSTPIVNT